MVASIAATPPGGLHQEFPQVDAAALALAVANHVAELLRQAVALRGHATLAVSGGRNPATMLRALQQLTVPWERVTVTLVDERWVASDSADSNERLVRDNLLVGAAAAARFVAFKTNAATPAAAVIERSKAIEALPLPFDVVILGMGDDGHTASLFPAATGLAAALDADAGPLLAAIVPPVAAHARLTLTLRGILSSRRIVLPISGEIKRSVLARAAKGASVTDLPIAAVLNQRRVPVDIYTSP
jgi:6-phosphogluconolactonase